MATKVLPGGITKGIRCLKKPESLQIYIDGNSNCWLVATEFGDTRMEPIHREVAELLIANGMGYGN